MKKIIIVKPDKERLFNHLLQDPDKENMAATLCGHSLVGKQLQLLVKEILLIEHDGLAVHARTGLVLTEDSYRKILTRCDTIKTDLIIWHSHPFADMAWFSGIDNNNDMMHAKFLTKHLPKAYYGNVVVAQKDYKARLFNKRTGLFEDIQEIVTFGQPN